MKLTLHVAKRCVLKEDETRPSRVSKWAQAAADALQKREDEEKRSLVSNRKLINYENTVSAENEELVAIARIERRLVRVGVGLASRQCNG